MEERLPNMDRWGLHPHGRYILDLERHYLDTILPRFFGYHLLQVGGPVSEPYLDASLINHHIRLDGGQRNDFDGSSVSSRCQEMPFLPGSIDVAVLPHVLEYLNDPGDFLKEVYQCLIGEGHVVVIAFNPLSPWGLTKLWRPDDVVWKRSKMHTLGQVKRWMKAAGFEITQQSRLGYRWPLRTHKALHKTMFLEAFGPLCWRFSSSVYAVIGRKRVITPIPLAEENDVSRLTVGVVEPTA